MSATLTWASSGNGTKTGTAVGNFYTDTKTLIDSKAGDSAFFWEVAASSLAGTPYYLWLRRKDGSNGRILIITWTSSPAGNNAAILDQAPTTNGIFIAWFPNGTAASPSNLTAASGSISGNDSNCVKVSPSTTIASGYGASVVPFYMDCEEGFVLFCQNPGSSGAVIFIGAGDLLVDASDVAYGCSFGNSGTVSSSWAGNGTAIFSYSSGVQNAGNATAIIRTNYGSANRNYYQAFLIPLWSTQAVGSGDILTDTANTKAWFVPVMLVASNVKGGGFQLKFRQMAIGPNSVGPYTIYNTTGPVVQARQCSNATTGSTGVPWAVNFKL
jgi:hypothetical protein